MVSKSGYKYLKQVRRVLCHKLPAESVEMRWTYVIHHVNDMYCRGSETEISRRSCNHIILHRNCMLAANRGCRHFLYNC
jgi:hypothetical protein